jgi:hypothetical protein
MYQGRLLCQHSKVLPYHSSAHGEKLTGSRAPSMLQPQGRMCRWMGHTMHVLSTLEVPRGASNYVPPWKGLKGGRKNGHGS